MELRGAARAISLDCEGETEGANKSKRLLGYDEVVEATEAGSGMARRSRQRTKKLPSEELDAPSLKNPKLPKPPRLPKDLLRLIDG